MIKHYWSWLLGCLLCCYSLLASADATVDALLRQASDPVMGNPNATVTVVEFFDYNCSHCIEMAPIIAQILEDNTSLRIVFKDYPILGAESEFAARAALAANLQHKYYALSHRMLTSKQPLTPAVITEYAKDAKLDLNRLTKDLYGPVVINQIKATRALANRLNINGTPAFFIAKTNATKMSEVTFISGSMSQVELQNAIDAVNAGVDRTTVG